MINKNIKRRLTELEKQESAELKSTFIIVNFVDHDLHTSNVYSRHPRGNDSPKVKQQPDEDHDKFFKLAKAELYGEDAEKPGPKLMFGFYE